MSSEGKENTFKSFYWTEEDRESGIESEENNSSENNSNNESDEDKSKESGSEEGTGSD